MANMTQTHFRRRMHHYSEAEQTSLHVVADLVTIKLKGRHLPHIVARILDLGEFWERSVVTRRESHHNRVAVRAFSGRTLSSAEPFLRSKPIQGSGMSPVRRIKITVLGRCQEWPGDLSASDGTGSWYQLASRSSHADEEYTQGPIIATNDAGRKKYQTHEAIVNFEGKETPEADQMWLRGLESEDIVYLFPKAQGTSWANYTLAASLEISSCMFAE